MLTGAQVNKVQGLLNYLNNSLPSGSDIHLADIEVVDSNGATVARLGYDGPEDEYVLMEVTP